jgi:hypothetical protein
MSQPETTLSQFEATTGPPSPSSALHYQHALRPHDHNGKKIRLSRCLTFDLTTSGV